MQMLEVNLLCQNQVIDYAYTNVQGLLLQAFDLVVYFRNPVNQIRPVQLVHLHKRHLSFRINQILLIESLDLIVPYASHPQKLPVLLLFLKRVLKYFLLIFLQFE